MKRKSREIKLGNVMIGGNNRPVLQSMITTPLTNYESALNEAEAIYEMGCGVIRTAFRKMDEVKELEKLVLDSKGEIIADIHFDYRLALAAIDAGVSGIRINPGNIGGKERVTEVLKRAATRPELAVRIGVNAGSLEKDLLKKFGGATGEAMIESTKRWVSYFEDEARFFNFKISAKSSSVRDTLYACRKIREFTDAPLHVGVTEAGGGLQGVVKSVAGIGILIDEGLADTFRISLTAPIAEEVRTGMHLLKSFGLLDGGGEIVSCPTCGRCHSSLFSYYAKLEKWFNDEKWWLKPSLKVALMGCEVNGPGEAREADLGLAFGKGVALFFEKGDAKKKFDNQDEAFSYLLSRVESLWKQ